MRTLLLAGILGFAAFAAGWFRIHRDGEHTTIRIDRGEIRSDARRAIDRGREILDQREAEMVARQEDRAERPVDNDDNRYEDRRYVTPSDYRYSNDRYDNDRYDDDRYNNNRYDDNRYGDDRYARPPVGYDSRR